MPKEPMARKRSKMGTEKHQNLQGKQCTREEEAKVDGMVERVTAGVYRKYFNSGKGKKKERIVLERASGPRPEARKEKGKRKVAKVTPEFAGAVGKQDTLGANCVKGKLKQL